MITCGVTVLVLAFGLGQSEGGLLPSGDLGQWEYGVPSGATDAVWTTLLDRNTLNDAVERLDVPVDLSSTTRPVLVVDHRWALGAGDTARFSWVWSGGEQALVPIGGYPGGDAYVGSGAARTGLDLTGLPAGGQVRLTLRTDAVGAGPGWTVSQLELYDGDPIPPRLRPIQVPTDNQDLLGPHAFEVEVLEDAQLVRTTLVYDRGSGPESVDLVQGVGNFVAAIPKVDPGTVVQWSVHAEDCSGPAEPLFGAFRVFLAAPEGLAGPEGPRVVATEATLSWQPPDSPWPVVGYDIEDLGQQTVSTSQNPTTSVLLVPDDQRFRVSARYQGPDGVVRGDPSPTLELGVEVPQLHEVSPSTALPGEEFYLELVGRSLYLQQGVSTLATEGPMLIEEFAVLNADRAVALVRIADDAPPGPLGLTVVGGQGTFSFPDAFTVGAGAAPSVVEVRPPSLVQGAEGDITFVTSLPLAPDVAIRLDDDFVLAGPVQVDGLHVTVRLAALSRAQPGPHTIVLDDGERLLTTGLRVDRFVAQAGGCQSVPPLLGIGAWGIVALGMRRRRNG